MKRIVQAIDLNTMHASEGLMQAFLRRWGLRRERWSRNVLQNRSQTLDIHGLLVAIILVLAGSSARSGSYEDFFRAVALDDARTVSRLVERGFDANWPAPDGQVALYLAMRDGSLQVAQALLAAPGLDVDLANIRGETPLMMAAIKGRLEWAQRLVQMGAAIRRPGWTPLHYAASAADQAQHQVAAFLLERGAEVDALAPNDTTPLMLAAGYGSEDTIRILLARGADITRRNARGLSAADFARYAGRDRLAQALQALVDQAEARPR
jgi:hypothetical protein